MTFAQAEPLRSSLHKLEELLKDDSLLMEGSREEALDRDIPFEAAFAEVNSSIRSLQGKLDDITKAAFSVAEVTFEVRAHYWRIRSRGNA